VACLGHPLHPQDYLEQHRLEVACSVHPRHLHLGASEAQHRLRRFSAQHPNQRVGFLAPKAHTVASLEANNKKLAFSRVRQVVREVNNSQVACLRNPQEAHLAVNLQMEASLQGLDCSEGSSQEGAFLGDNSREAVFLVDSSQEGVFLGASSRVGVWYHGLSRRLLELEVHWMHSSPNKGSKTSKWQRTESF
jgi:hypothetical protein